MDGSPLGPRLSTSDLIVDDGNATSSHSTNLHSPDTLTLSSPLQSVVRSPVHFTTEEPNVESLEKSSKINIDSSVESQARFNRSPHSDNVGVNLRIRPTPGTSKTSTRSSFALHDSMLGRLSSNIDGLRESFLGAIGRGTVMMDPLELSPNHEFDLEVIDESAALDESIGQLLRPQVNFTNWSKEGYIVLSLGLVLVLLTFGLAASINSINGYNIDPGLVFGSLLTLILCTVVFITYHGVQSYQRHPNPLIYYKCVIDILLAVRFLLDPLLLDLGIYKVNDDASCSSLSGITQFLYLSSECWYFAQIIDLYWSLTNPFMSVKANRRRFKLMVYSIGTFTGLLAVSIPSIHGLADGNYCWTKRHTTRNPLERDFFHLNRGSWLLFYMWMIVIYLSGIAVIMFGVKRLRSGLRATLQSRRDMLRNGALSIMSYTIYWTIVFICYALSFQTRTTYDIDGNLPPSHTFRIFAFCLSARGAVDYLVWFMINSPSLIQSQWLQFSTDSADKKFSAQLNTALQEELIYFTIEGMTRAIQLADDELARSQDRSPTQKLILDNSDEEIEATTKAHASLSSSNLLHTLQKNRVLCNLTGAIQAKLHHSNKDGFDIPQGQRVQEATMGHKHSSLATTATAESSARGTTSASIRFTPYKPQTFAELRQAYNIKAAAFLKSFQTSTKPKISEGASGAFMFYSGDKKYIVKSLAEEEARFLCDVADKYTEYLMLTPTSLITKFYGCFKITMYNMPFYFIVMENLFDVMEEGVQIHHRFDIKGSWVNRSYKRPRRGAKVKCRHCSMTFKYGAKKSLLQCPNVVGLHEPNVVLKDNDLRTRMRIGIEEGIELYEQLRDDSLFLCDLGIMDYSLLLGVMDIEFVVDQPFKPAQSSIQTTANNTVLTNSNDSFLSASSSNFLNSINTNDTPRQVQKTNTTDMRYTPSVHSLFQEPSNLLNQSRCPSSGGEPRSKRSMRKSQRVFGPGYYYVGIIDILQTWTLQKRLERFWKVNIQQKDGDGLSAIDPLQYQQRFEAKLREIIAMPKEYHRRQRRHHPTMLQSVQRLSPVLLATAAFESAGAAKDLARERGESTDTDDSGVSITVEEGDLEQAGRNPQPILLPFNQRLISSSRSLA